MPMRTMQRILLLLLSLIPLSKSSNCSTPGFHTFDFGQCSRHHHSRPLSGWHPTWSGPPIVEQVWDKIITVADHFCTAEHDFSAGFMGRPSRNLCVCRFHQGAFSVFDVLAFAFINYTRCFPRLSTGAGWMITTGTCRTSWPWTQPATSWRTSCPMSPSLSRYFLHFFFSSPPCFLWM